MKKILLSLCAVFILQAMAFAQQSESTNSPADSLNFWKKHNVKFAAMPMINYDPALGWNMAALTNTFFRVSPSDTISPLSMAGGMLGYTTNKSWYWQFTLNFILMRTIIELL